MKYSKANPLFEFDVYGHETPKDVTYYLGITIFRYFWSTRLYKKRK